MRAVIIFLAAVLVIIIGAWATLVIYFDEARMKQLATEQVRAEAGRELHLDGPLRLKILPRLSVEAQQVRLSGPEAYDGPEMFEAEHFSISLKLIPLLRGIVEAGTVELERAELRFHTDRQGRSSLDNLAREAPAEPAAAPRITSERIRLRDVSLVLSDARTDSVERYLIDLLELDGFAFDRPVEFRFRGNLGEPPLFESLAADGRLLVPSGAGPLQLSDLKLDGRVSGLTVGLTGTASIQPGPPLTAEFSQGRLQLDEDHFDLAFSYREASRPQISASLAGERLDMDGLLAHFADAPGPAEEQAEAAGQPLLMLRDIDLDAGLELGWMQLSGLQLRRVEARAESRDGVLVIEPLAGALAAGNVSASARIDLNAVPPLVSVRPNFELARLGEALAPWGLDRFIEGAGTLAFELSGRGLEPAELLRTLSGDGRYDFRDGRIHGLDLDGMVGALRDRDLAAAARAGVGGETAFRRFSGQLSISDGHLRLPDLELATERLGIGGSVSLRLEDLGLDGQLRLSGERLDRIPLGLAGTLSNPSLSPDIGQALQEEAGRRVLDLLERRRSRQEEPESDPEG